MSIKTKLRQAYGFAKIAAEKAYSATESFARRNYPHVKQVIYDNARIAREAYGETINEVRNIGSDETALREYAKMLETAPERLQERLDSLNLNHIPITPARDIQIRRQGPVVILEQRVSADLVAGYIIDPINNKIKQYHIRRH